MAAPKRGTRPRVAPVQDAALGPRSELDDATLVSRIRAGDRAAFGDVFLAHYGPMVRLAAVYLRSIDHAEEVVQDLFLSLWDGKANLEVSGPLAHYLLRSARNRALNAVRRQKLEARFRESSLAEQALSGELEAATPPSEGGVELDEFRSAAQRAIAALPERCRTAYMLHRQQHLTYAEIAAVMGIAPGTVMVQIGRALKALRVALADWIDRPAR